MRSPWTPLHIERAEGAYLYTKDGRKLLDAGSGAVVVNIGQGREELAKIAEETVRAPELHRSGMGLDRAREAGQSPRRMDASRAQPLLLHQRRVRGSRGGAQVRDALPKGEGQAVEEENHLASVLVSRQHAGRAFCRQQLAPRRLRTRALRLAENPALVLLSMPVGQDLSLVRYRLRHTRSRRRSISRVRITSRLSWPSR